MLRVCRFGKGSERAVRASGSSFRPKPRGILQLLPRACREAAMAMTIDCGKLVSKFNSPPAAMSLKVGMTTGPQEEMATPKLGPGAGEMDGVLADALNSRLQQLRQMFLKMEEGRSDPGSLGHDIVKVPVPPGPMLLPPPQPHSVQRPPKDPRCRPMPGNAKLVFSKGSVGHPFTCAAACRYVKRKGGCLRGADCNLCHECFWSKEAQGEEATPRATEAPRKGPVFIPTQEDLADFTTGPLSREPLPEQAWHPGSDILGYSMGSTLVQARNPGSLGHPHACGPACKYAQKSRGCKDGDLCTRCHLCLWTRFSAKTLKLIESLSEK